MSRRVALASARKHRHAARQSASVNGRILQYYLSEDEEGAALLVEEEIDVQRFVRTVEYFVAWPFVYDVSVALDKAEQLNAAKSHDAETRIADIEEYVAYAIENGIKKEIGRYPNALDAYSAIKDAVEAGASFTQFGIVSFREGIELSAPYEQPVPAAWKKRVSARKRRVRAVSEWEISGYQIEFIKEDGSSFFTQAVRYFNEAIYWAKNTVMRRGDYPEARIWVLVGSKRVEVVETVKREDDAAKREEQEHWESVREHIDEFDREGKAIRRSYPYMATIARRHKSTWR